MIYGTIKFKLLYIQYINEYQMGEDAENERG